MTNGVGWDFLFNGSMVRAAYQVYDGSAALNGFALAILYFVFQTMLWFKTKNPLPGIVIGMFFLSMYYANQFFEFMTIHSAVAWVAGIFLILQLAGFLYKIIIKH